MTPLPFFSPQYNAAGIKRAVQAHVTRGLSYWLNTLDDPRAHPLNSLFLFDLHRQTRMPHTRSVDSGNASHVIKQFLADCKPWENCDRVQTLFWALSTLRAYTHTMEEYENVLAKAYYYHHCVYHRPTSTRKETMKQDDLAKLPADIYAKLESNLASLEQTLLAKDPMMPQHLRTIHATVIAYPEAVHLLKDDEIARIISGAEEMTKTKIVSDAAKKATVSRTKSLKNVSVSDL